MREHPLQILNLIPPQAALGNHTDSKLCPGDTAGETSVLASSGHTSGTSQPDQLPQALIGSHLWKKTIKYGFNPYQIIISNHGTTIISSSSN